jgi:DNA-binding FrmR family transcriptional regulator
MESSVDKVCHIPKKGPGGVNADALRRLKRAEGQVRGIIRMVEDENYCPDILTQIAAARSALRKAGLSILKRHVESCVTDALRSGEEEGDALIEEMMMVLDRHGI